MGSVSVLAPLKFEARVIGLHWCSTGALGPRRRLEFLAPCFFISAFAEHKSRLFHQFTECVEVKVVYPRPISFGW